MSLPKTIGKKHNLEITVSDEQWELIFDALNKGDLVKDSLEQVVLDIAKGTFDLSKYKPMSDDELRAELSNIISQNAGAHPKAIIGKAMGALKGKADGAKIMKMLKELQS
ncbi:hypothetical protein D6774_01385 [Candidatus Woesearchaeota archaeon]|nr:MAG: hypothetical protein D6774_01385 [Candidatus Woesearchaeota archaeon]